MNWYSNQRLLAIFKEGKMALETKNTKKNLFCCCCYCTQDTNFSYYCSLENLIRVDIIKKRTFNSVTIKGSNKRMLSPFCLSARYFGHVITSFLLKVSSKL